VDGTASVNQTNLSVVNQVITNWPPGAALWLVWQMTDPAGRSQGLAIDNLSFSASSQGTVTPVPINFQSSAGNLVLFWTGLAGQVYQVEYKDDLNASTWIALGTPLTGTGSSLSITNDFNLSVQRFFRLRLLP
jgi:hypothetical protein